MAVALRVLLQRQPGFQVGARRHLRLAWPELDWLRQQADSTLPTPVTRLAMPPPPQEMSMQRANSLALEQARPQALKKQPKAQVKLRVTLWPVMLGWLQQVEPMAPVTVTRPAMRPQQQEMSMQQANSLVLEKLKPQALKKQMDSQVKLRAALWPVKLPGQESLRGSRSAQAKRFLLPKARVCRCWKDLGPCAFFPEAPAARKHNRAARFGARPICDRCQTPHNRPALAGCGNRCSHWPHKFCRHGRPFPILGRDRRQCLLRPFADRDVRSADSELRSSPSMKKRTSRKFREREGRILS